jgi:GntR family transcriptional regulator/MocR family aminotransferase
MVAALKLNRDQPLQRQLYEQLRHLILSAHLAAGTRMPSTRVLAAQFGVSRITVLLTYDRLIAEGLLRTVPASGTFVAPVASAVTAPPVRPPVLGCPGVAESDVGRPDPRLFPSTLWRTLVRAPLEQLGSSTTADDGEHGLRAAVADWLSSARGLSVQADQVILAASRRQALNVALLVLLRPGSRAVMEQPGDERAERLVRNMGGTVVAVPVDADGLRTELLPPGEAALALVAPDYHRTLGVSMSASRRDGLLAWAARAGATVIEDDAAGDLRYEPMAMPGLISLDHNEAVMRIGDFEATLSPGTKLSYLIVPRRLIEAAHVASMLIGETINSLEIAAVTALLRHGTYGRHLTHLRKTYVGRRDALIAALRGHFGADIRLGGMAGGLHLTWRVPDCVGPASVVADTARACGLDAERCGDRVVLLGFGMAPDEATVGRLARRLSAERYAPKLIDSRTFRDEVAPGIDVAHTSA